MSGTSEKQYQSFIAVLLTNLRRSDLDPSEVQRIIDDPQDACHKLVGFINAGCPVVEPTEIIRWRKISDTCIEVNLDVPPVLPFRDAKPVIWNQQSGWVRLELRDDGELYRNGTKVELFLTKEQKTGGSIQGYDLRKKIEGKVCLHPNELDALMENTHLLPRSWKQDNNGRRLFIYFWAVGFSDSNSNLCVRSLYRDACQWNRSHAWLALYWDVRRPAAIIAS